jgi:hypothetical protein
LYRNSRSRPHTTPNSTVRLSRIAEKSNSMWGS